MTFAVLLAVPAVAAIADTINSDIVGVSDNNSGPYKAGSITGASVDYWINQSGSDGCDATGGMSFTLKATNQATNGDASSLIKAKGPADAVSKSLNTFSLPFSQCGSSTTNFKTVEFTSSNALPAGQYKIEVNVVTDTTGANSYNKEYSTATTSGLKYDPVASQYIYNMKTDAKWAGSCRQLIVKLDDDTIHRANFNFFRS